MKRLIKLSAALLFGGVVFCTTPAVEARQPMDPEEEMLLMMGFNSPYARSGKSLGGLGKQISGRPAPGWNQGKTTNEKRPDNRRARREKRKRKNRR